MSAPTFLLPPTPKRAQTLVAYQQNVETWTRQAQQTAQQHDTTIKSLQALVQQLQTQVAALQG